MPEKNMEKLKLYYVFEDGCRHPVQEPLTFEDFQNALNPNRIIRNGPATIVMWADSSKTIVKRSKDTPDDPYNAYCAALAKKIYGSNSRIHKIVEKTEVQSNEKSLVEQLKDTINDLAKRLNVASGGAEK